MRLVLSSDKDIVGGAVCFEGTRIPVAVISRFLKAGDSIDTILSEYPTLQRDQVTMVWFLCEALRDKTQERDDGGTHMDGLWTEAADHIEQLEAEVEKWKTAFAAQTRKLQLAIGAGGPPVRDALNDFRAHAHKRRCPIGLDDNRKMCSAGTCDACMAERTEFFGYEPRHRGVDLDVPKEVWVERVTNRWSKDTYLCVHPSPVHDGMVRYVHEDFVQEKDNEQH